MCSRIGEFSVAGTNFSPEFKQETDTKGESLAMGHLAEVPASYITSTEQTSAIILIESDSKDDTVAQNPFRTKAKKENTESSGKKSKANGPTKGAIHNSRDQRSSNHRNRNAKFNLKKSNSRKAKQSIKAKVQGNRLKQQCQQCGYTTKYMSIFKKHLLVHTGERPFPCSHCSKAFKQKQDFRRHMATHVEEFPHHCRICLQGFNGRNDNFKHEAKCRTLRYECCFCTKSFGSQKTHLICHMRLHSGEKPFACQQCSLRFTDKSGLNKHMKRRHVERRSYHRSVRRQEFPELTQNRAHERSSDQRKYECYLCKKCIGPRYSDLKRHMLQHSAEKPLRCEICLATFTRKNSLIFHLNFIHGGDKVMNKVTELKHKTTHNGNPTEIPKAVETTTSSVICPTNELLTDNAMDTSIATGQSSVSTQHDPRETDGRSVLESTLMDYVNHTNQPVQAAIPPTLKFVHIWQNLDNLFQQMAQRDVNELNMKFIAQAFEKIENNE